MLFISFFLAGTTRGAAGGNGIETSRGQSRGKTIQVNWKLNQQQMQERKIKGFGRIKKHNNKL
jgi:hypothetical protein